MGFALLAIPIVAVLLFILFKKKQFWHITSLISSVLLLIGAALITKNVMLFKKVEYAAWAGFLCGLVKALS
jgi:hypothetical protein